ncbi:hypothetical protein ABVK25_000201 [Lepraria finkii]|uniref:B box-type domain-containing protein n=1 Tax=Lepraria finkii TaxID=1340010 RepID=A0ABR4BQ20_9LECA
MAQTTHKTFQEIVVHTAKCEECNKHNKAIMYRCTDCGHQFCTRCWNQTGGLGTHSKASNAMQRPIVLPYVKVDQKKVVKKTSHSVVRPTRKKKNVVESDDDDGEDKQMRDESPAIEKTAREKRSMTVTTGRASAPSHGPRTGENSASLHQATDSPSSFRRGIVPHNTPRTGTLISPSSPDVTGIDTLLRAAASIESMASQIPAPRIPSATRMRSLNAISIESLCSPSPGPQSHTPSKPRTPRLPDLSSHATSSFARRAAQLQSPRFIPEEQASEDVPMYDYSGSTGFVPVNSPKVRKSRSGSLAGGRGYGADLATRMMARAETEKGGRQIDEDFGQGRERRFEYPDTPAPPMISQRNGTVNFGGNIEGVDGRLSGSGERKHEYSSGNGTDIQGHPYPPTRPYQYHPKDPRV